MSCFYLCQARKSVITSKKVKLPADITVNDHFTDKIQKGLVDGDKPALIGDEGVTLWTPMQLDLTANKLAKAIRKLLGYWTNNNAELDLVIGFCLHTTENIILIILATLKLGATYFSFSTNYPEQQIVRIVGVIRPLLIVTESDPQIVSRFDSVKHICEILPLYDIIDNSCEFEGDPNDPVPLESLLPPWRRAACIILTAGTTNEPRFVRIGHMAILNRLYWQYKAIPYSEGEVACLSSLIVDCESVAEIFAPLLGGVPLHIIRRHIIGKPAMLLDKMKEIKISRITITPANLNAMLTVMEELGLEESREAFSSLKYLIISGDVLSVISALKCFQYFPANCGLIYFYGSTETMSEATWEHFSNEEELKEKAYGQQVPIGRPLCNTKIYILDEDFNIVPDGTIGEISISGKCLSLGYSGSRDTTNRFIQYPPGAKKSGQIKIFRTGDFGKIVKCDGNEGRRLYYEGRIDMTMRIQGKEIELNDIAVAVESTELCVECAVLCYRRNKEDEAAVAFCVLKENVSKEMLVEGLKKVLEDIMVPDVYPVNELPYLPSGRLDRQKLLKVYKFRRMESTPEDWKSLNLGFAEKQAAKTLFEAISHTIGLALRFVMSNYQTSFWNIGGNSLNALVIVHILRENGYLISIDEFVMADTLASITKSMVASSKNPVTFNQMLIHINDLASLKYELESLSDGNKKEVIGLLSKTYGERGTLSILAGITQQDYVKYIEIVWDNIVKENLSVIVIDKATGKIVASALSTDVNSRHGIVSKKRVEKHNPIIYYIELLAACEALARQTTISREKGKVFHIFMMGTDTTVESKLSPILIEFLLKGCMQRALYRGYSWTLVMSESPLIRDLCGNILQYDLIAEIKLNSFVAKDKTKPFRKARDFQSFRAYHRLFT